MAGGQLHLGFGAGGEKLAMPAAGVAEVARVPATTRVPNAPASLLGLASLRGTVLPVVSLAMLLGRTQETVTQQARLLVLAGAAPAGVLVDWVASIGPPGTARTLDVPALLDRAFAGSRRHAAPASPPRPQPAAPARKAETLALIGLRVAGQDYALRLHDVVGTLRLPAAVSHVPGADRVMLGVMPYAGGTLPLVSLAALLGLPACGGGGARVVVTAVCGTVLGLVADAVTGTLTLPADTIDPVPAVLTRGAGEAMLEGLCRLDGGARLVGLLSSERLFDADTLARLQATGRQETGPEPTQAAAGGTERFVLVRLGGEQYGLPLAAVDEVVRRPEALTRLPRASDFLPGMMALRGRSVPVIDLARRFGLQAGEGPGRLLVVISDGGLQAGLAVDAVSEVVHLPEAALHPAPALADGSDAPFDRVALHHAGRVVLLVSAGAVLAQARRDLAAAAA